MLNSIAKELVEGDISMVQIKSLPPEYAADLIPEAGLVKSKSFMDNEVKKKAHAHAHKVAEGARRAKFLSGKGHDQLFVTQNLHQQADGIVGPINGNASGNQNGEEILHYFTGSFPRVPGVKSQKFGKIETYRNGNQITHPEGTHVIPLKEINKQGGPCKILDDNSPKSSYKVAD